MGHKEDIDQFEASIEKLKFAYEQYFMGFERVPPEKLRADCEKQARKFIGFNPPNSGLRFRAQNLVQRMTTMRTLWDRQLREIEAGTFKRHVFKANLRTQAPPKPGRSTDDVIEDAEFYEEEAPAKKWGSVFDQYLSARGQSGEGVKGVTYEKLHEVLEKQSAQLREKYKAKDVEFKVVVEDGKAKLKAVPKK
jgi:hypothetical protein